MEYTRVIENINKIIAIGNPKECLKKYISTLNNSILSEVISYADDMYYNSDQPIFTDYYYDILRSYASSLSSKVGHPVDGSRKVSLPYYMGSMNKCKDPLQIDQWKRKWKNGNVVLSDKLDGNSCMFVYNKQANEIKLYTRGDGSNGLDITHVAQFVKGIPASRDFNYAIRGEMIISKKEFKEISQKYPNVSNARNVVAGLLNAKNPDTDMLKSVTFVAYELVSPKTSTYAQFDFIKENCECVYHQLNNINDITPEFLNNLLCTRKDQSEYEIDGIIIAYDCLYDIIKLENPKHAFAYKSVDCMESRDTIVRNVEWKVSKDLFIKPVVVFDNVCIGGVNIKRATGFNAKFIVDNGIGINSKITVMRSGDVIPKITRVIEPTGPCLPDCDYTWNDSKVDIIASKTDSEADISRLVFFFSKIHAFGMSKGILTKLYNNGFDTIKKIIHATAEDLCNIPGIKNTLAIKTVGSIKNSLEKCSVLDMLVASNTFGRGIGISKLKAVLSKYPSILDFEIPTVTQICDIGSFDVASAERVITGISTFRQFVIDTGLESIFKTKKISFCNESTIKDQKQLNNEFTGKNVVFTGVRNKILENFILESGGNVKSVISKNTNLLICSDINSISSKITTAKSLGIEIKPLSEFSKYIK